MVIPLGGLSLQEDCHLVRQGSQPAVKPASSLSTDLLGDVRFCVEEVIWSSYRSTCAA